MTKGCDSDEFDCEYPRGEGYECIPNEWICDAEADCLDAADEAGCNSK